MKIFKLIFGFTLLVTVFTVSVFAQNDLVNKKVKIALINSDVFESETKGIKTLVQAKISADSSDNFYLSGLFSKVNELQTQLDKLVIQKEPINEKYIVLQQTKSELKNAKERDDAYRSRMFSLLVKPVYEKIQQKLKEFIRLKGFDGVIDKSATQIFTENETIDITSEFIQFCNKSFDKEKIKSGN